MENHPDKVSTRALEVVGDCTDMLAGRLKLQDLKMGIKIDECTWKSRT